MTALEDRLYQAIILDFEGRGEAWTTDDSGDTLVRAAAEVAAREVAHLLPPETETVLADRHVDDLLALLPAVQAGVRDADTAVRRLVDHLRIRGVSYAAIGAALGVSRQAAWERFTR